MLLPHPESTPRLHLGKPRNTRALPTHFAWHFMLHLARSGAAAVTNYTGAACASSCNFVAASLLPMPRNSAIAGIKLALGLALPASHL